MKGIFGISFFILFIFNLSAQNKQRPTQPDLPGDLMLDFGVNRWSKDNEPLETRLMKSNSFGIYYSKRFRLSDYISFHPAVGLTFDQIAFGYKPDEDNNKKVWGEYTWLRQPDGTIVIDSVAGIGVSKNKLITRYFEIPIEFRIHPLGTVKGEGLFIGLGAIGGVRIGSNTKLVYSLDKNTEIKEKLYDDFDQARLRYGVQARLGFKNVHLFYKMYFSNQFNKEFYPGSGKPRVTTFGINVSGF